jgi:hypothetical protein
MPIESQLPEALSVARRKLVMLTNEVTTYPSRDQILRCVPTQVYHLQDVSLHQITLAMVRLKNAI